MEDTGMNNCDYNCVQQLWRQLKFLSNFDNYIKDAEDCGHDDCKKAFEEIKKNTQRHVKLLKGILVSRTKEGVFD